MPCCVSVRITVKLFLQVDNAKHQYENLLLSSACETVLEIGNLRNLYVDEQAHGPVSSKGVRVLKRLQR